MFVRAVSITLLLMLLLPITAVGMVSEDLNSGRSLSITIQIEPRVAYSGNYSVIRYSLSHDKVRQFYVIGYYAVPSISLIIMNQYGFETAEVSVEFDNPVRLELSKPLYRIRRIALVSEPVVRDEVTAAPEHFSHSVMEWRGISLTSVRLMPADVQSDHCVVVYRTVRVTAYFRPGSSDLARPLPDLRTLAAASALAVNVPSMPVDPGSFENRVILVITRSVFTPYLSRYAALRSTQGFKVEIATVEDILDSGTQGRDIPEKIRNYVYSEYVRLGNRLAYVVIFGDASGNTGWPNGPYSLSELEDWEVPTRYFYNPDGATGWSHTGNYTPSDWYYVTFDSTWDSNNNGVFGEPGDSTDWAPEVPIGRVPVRTPEELEDYIDSLIRYNRSKIDSMLLIGSTLWFYGEYDPSYGGQGDTRAEVLWNSLRSTSALATTKPLRLYEHYPVYSIIDDPGDQNGNLSKEGVLDTISGYGPDIVVWFAHGSPTAAWRKVWEEDSNQNGKPDSEEMMWEQFISAYDQIISQGRNSLVLALSCLTAYYDRVGEDSLGEKLLKTAAVWYLGWNRVTWDSLLPYDMEINPSTWPPSSGTVYRFLTYLLNDTGVSKYDIGYSAVQTLIWMSNRDMSSQIARKVWWAFTLLGDPSQPLYRTYEEPRAFLTPQRGHAGTVLRITGQGFVPNTTVTIYLDSYGTVLSSTETDESGGFMAYVQIPPDLSAPGEHAIIVEDGSGVSTTLNFTLTQPYINISLGSPAVGEPIRVEAGNLTPHELYYIMIDNSVLLATPYVSDDEGSLRATIWATTNTLMESGPRVPVLLPGEHTISIVYNPWYYSREGGSNITAPLTVLVTAFNISRGAASTENIDELRLMIAELSVRLENNYRELSELINKTRTILENYIVANITFINRTLHDTITEQVSELEKRLSDAIKGNITELNQSIISYIDASINKLRNYIDEAILANITYINDSLSSLLNTEIRGLREELEAVKEDVAGLSHDTEDLNRRIGEINTALDTIQKKLNTLSDAATRLNESIQEALKLIDGLTAEIAEIKENISETNSVINNEIMESINNMNSTLSNLKLALNDLRRSLMNSISNINATIQGISNDVSALQDRLSTLSDQADAVKQLETRIDELETELNTQRTINYVLIAGVIASITASAVVFTRHQK